MLGSTRTEMIGPACPSACSTTLICFDLKTALSAVVAWRHALAHSDGRSFSLTATLKSLPSPSFGTQRLGSRGGL
jgi:hypothetical protein